MLGVNSFYRPFLVQNSKVTSLELIDVSSWHFQPQFISLERDFSLSQIFTFGHVLFEMQSSYSLQEPYAREITDCPSSLSKITSSSQQQMMLIHPMRFPAHLMKISFPIHRNTARASHHEGFIQNVHTDIRQDQDARILPWLCVHFWAETCRIKCDHREAECELRCECKGFHLKIVAKIWAEIERWTEIGERVAAPQHKLCKKNINYLISPHRSKVRSEVWHRQIRNIITRRRSVKIKRG